MADQTDAEIIDRWLPDIQSGAYKHRMSSVAAIAYVEATAREIKRLRSALFAIEVHGGSAETYDPVVEAICRDALTHDTEEGMRDG